MSGRGYSLTKGIKGIAGLEEGGKNQCLPIVETCSFPLEEIRSNCAAQQYASLRSINSPRFNISCGSPGFASHRVWRRTVVFIVWMDNHRRGDQSLSIGPSAPDVWREYGSVLSVYKTVLLY